jgi:ubiquitin-conjugating enzyme E2 S
MLSSAQNLPPQIFKRLAKELSVLVKDPIDGIQLSTDEETLAEINAEIQGPEGTPYEGGTFRVKLVLGSTFPQHPPKGYFLTPIFHPNVDQFKGEICVNTLKKDWSSDHKLKHVLIVIRCLLIHPNPDSALNEEAGKLLHESYKEFFARASLYTQIHAAKKKELTAQKENLQNLAEVFSIKQKSRSISNQRILTRKQAKGKGKKSKKAKKTLRRL